MKMINDINRYEIVEGDKFSFSGKSLKFNLNNEEKTTITTSIDKNDIDLNLESLIQKYKKVFEMELKTLV